MTDQTLTEQLRDAARNAVNAHPEPEPDQAATATGAWARLWNLIDQVDALETGRVDLDRQLAEEIEEHAATEQRLARDRDEATAEATRLSRQLDMNTGARDAFRQVQQEFSEVRAILRRLDQRLPPIERIGEPRPDAKALARALAQAIAEALVGHGWGVRDDADVQAMSRVAAAAALSYTPGCPTCTGQSRETVGMVCQTCGTDYAPDAAAEPARHPDCRRLEPGPCPKHNPTCGAIIDHDHPVPTVCIREVGTPDQRCSDHEDDRHQPCRECTPETKGAYWGQPVSLYQPTEFHADEDVITVTDPAPAPAIDLMAALKASIAKARRSRQAADDAPDAAATTGEAGQ